MTRAMSPSPPLSRLIEAVALGRAVHRRISVSGFRALNGEEWREFFLRVAELPSVHPAAQKCFLEIWVRRVGGGQMREKVGDDDAFFAGLRRLLPAYDGPAMDLWRGQVCGEALGLSWTEDFPIAREFALFGVQAFPRRL
jgi:hypothetical protein